MEVEGGSLEWALEYESAGKIHWGMAGKVGVQLNVVAGGLLLPVAGVLNPH